MAAPMNAAGGLATGACGGAAVLRAGPAAPDLALWRGWEEEVRRLPAALLLRVLQQLPPNEVACTARLVCKEWAEACSSPQHRTVRLSRPLPPHAAGLVRYWEGGLPRLSFRGKLQLLSTAAASGCEINLEVAWALLQPSLIAEQTPDYYGRFYGPNGQDPGTAAATRGHAHLLPWLLAHRCPLDPGRTLAAVAEHCDLAALQRAWEALRVADWPDTHLPHVADCLEGSFAAAAVRSSTPDALQKLGWLLPQLTGLRGTTGLCRAAAALGDLPRLQWLRDRGVTPDGVALLAALASPAAGVEVVERLEQQGAGSVAEAWQSNEWASVDGWSLPCPGVGDDAGKHVSPHKLEWVASRPGVDVQPWHWPLACVEAARAGDLPLVARLHEARGAALSEDVWEAAAGSGSTELLSWLLARGCPMGPGAYWAAARRGCAQLYAWLLHGARCPLPRAFVLVSLVGHWGEDAGAASSQRTGAAALAGSAAGAGEASPAAAGGGGAGEGSGGGAADEGSGLLRAVQLLVDAGADLEQEWDGVLNTAARRGDLPLVQLLASLGGIYDMFMLAPAAAGGCEDVVRWVVERGCPMDFARDAYSEACGNGDAATLRALLALGAPCGEGVVRELRKRSSSPDAPAVAALERWAAEHSRRQEA